MRILIYLLLVFCPMAIYAQTESANKYNSVPVKSFEGEVFLGFTVPLGVYNGESVELGKAFGYEFRYNIQEMPFDFSAQINSSTTVDNSTYSFAIFGDWNFGQGRRANVFAGVGVGWAGHSSSDWSYICDYYDDEKSKPILIPRVGVELFSHLRLTLSSNISGKGYNNLQLSIGVVFGGGKK